MRQVMWRTMPMVLLVVIATGCANKDKQTIVTLELNNQDLTERLNGAMSELRTADQRYNQVDQQLQVAFQDAELCHAQLAARPEPEAPKHREMTTEPPIPGWIAAPGGAVIKIEGSELFAPGATTVREQARRSLDSIASALKGPYGNRDIIVFGHTDNQPITKSGWADNWQLSTERALAVVRYFQQCGVSPDRLIASGCGEHRPRVDNKTIANRATNRRIEIMALDPRVIALQP